MLGVQLACSNRRKWRLRAVLTGEPKSEDMAIRWYWFTQYSIDYPAREYSYGEMP